MRQSQILRDAQMCVTSANIRADIGRTSNTARQQGTGVTFQSQETTSTVESLSRLTLCESTMGLPQTTYTVRFISFRTEFFFLITELERSIGQPTKYYQPTSVHTPSFVCFIFDSVRIITCLVQPIFFIRHGWRKWTERCHKSLFQSRSICYINTSIGAKVHGNEALYRLNDFRSYSRFRDGKGAGRIWRERWPSKIDSKWDTHCCCYWFGQKWPSNRIKNDSRIFDIPKTVVLWILKEDLGKKNLYARYVPRSLTPEQREDRVTSCRVIIATADADKHFF